MTQFFPVSLTKGRSKRYVEGKEKRKKNLSDSLNLHKCFCSLRCHLPTIIIMLFIGMDPGRSCSATRHAPTELETSTSINYKVHEYFGCGELVLKECVQYFNIDSGEQILYFYTGYNCFYCRQFLLPTERRSFAYHLALFDVIFSTTRYTVEHEGEKKETHIGPRNSDFIFMNAKISPSSLRIGPCCYNLPAKCA